MNNTETSTTTKQYENATDCQWTTLDWSRCARKAAEGEKYCRQHANTLAKRQAKAASR